MQLVALLTLSIFLTTYALVYAEGPLSVEGKTLRVAPPLKKKPPPCPRLDLHAALKTRNAQCIGDSLRHMDVNDRDPRGDTALHKAVAMNNLNVIKFLVKRGADILYRDFNGFNARQIADNASNRPLVDYFMELERETERLFEAVEANDIVAASSSLLRGAALGARDVRLDTLLHRAAQSNFPQMGQLLIHHGAGIEARNHLGETPLISAALRDHAEFMEMLVKAGANVNAVDERRRTALDLAGVKENPKVLKLLKTSKARAGTPASVEHDWSESGPPVGPWGSP